MEDENGNILYIGKALNLKRRVSSYFRCKTRSIKNAQLIDLVFDIEKEINKIIDFFKKNFSISIDNKKEKIFNIIKSTKFNNLKNIEKKEGFFEKSEYSNFFRNGKMNQWKKKLNSNQKKIIIKYFEKQMIDLKYI